MAKYDEIIHEWNKYTKTRKRLRELVCRSNALLEGEFSEYITEILFNAPRCPINHENYDCKDRRGITYTVRSFNKADSNKKSIRLLGIDFKKVDFLIIVRFDPAYYKIIGIYKIPKNVLIKSNGEFQVNVNPRKKKWQKYKVDIKKILKPNEYKLFKSIFTE